jgi:hypothetical protein
VAEFLSVGLSYSLLGYFFPHLGHIYLELGIFTCSCTSIFVEVVLLIYGSSFLVKEGRVNLLGWF